MRYFCLLLFFSLLLLGGCNPKPKINQQPDNSSKTIDPTDQNETIGLNTVVDFELLNDSGFILEKPGAELMHTVGLTDTADSWWDRSKPTDTIGKYYKSSLTGNYVLCMIDFQEKHEFETHVLLELQPLSQTKYTLIKAERYIHGNYSCCWNNSYEGFTKLKDFFIIKTCGTGSGFCCSFLYFFQRVTPQDDLIPIQSWGYSFWDEWRSILSSKYQIKDSTLIFDFTIKNEDRKNGKTTKTKSNSCRTYYDFINGNWIPRDSLCKDFTVF